MEITTVYAKESAPSMVSTSGEVNTRTPEAMESVALSAPTIPQAAPGVNGRYTQGNGAVSMQGSVGNEGAAAESQAGMLPHKGYFFPGTPHSGMLPVDESLAVKQAANAAASGMLPVSAQVRKKERLSKAGSMLEYTGIRMDVDDATISMVQRLSHATGRKIRFYRSETGENGYYSKADQIIWVNAGSRNPVAQIVAHELTHSIEFADAYHELSALVQTRIARTGGSMEQLRRDKIRQYAAWGEQLDSVGAMREVVAEYVEKNLLTDEAAIVEMAQHNPTLVQKIRDFLNRILSALQTKVGMSATKAQEYTEIRRMLDTYTRALQQSAAGKPMVEEGFPSRKTSGSGGQYSISPIEGTRGSYGNGVLLDTGLFDGVHPRDWGKVLGKYVYENLAGTNMTVYDNNGNPETIHIAKANDRVRKNGAKNSHKVIDEIARYRGNNTVALATIHLSELLETSGNETTTNDKSHQWLDENGWRLRTAYAMDRQGKIYQITLNIADGRNGLTMYKISRVHQMDTKK